jgi:hypothetical protein
MHIVYDAASLDNLVIPLAVPLIPLMMGLWGSNRSWAVVKPGISPAVSARIFVFGTLFMFVIFAAIFWGNAYRVEHDYSRGHVSEVEGEIEHYQVSGDGKFVSFTVKGIPFDVSCCSPSPVYRGTPTSGLSPEVLYGGMQVRLTFLKTGEIVRIEVSGEDQPKESP